MNEKQTSQQKKSWLKAFYYGYNGTRRDGGHNKNAEHLTIMYLLCEFLVQSVRSSIAVHDFLRLSLSVYVIAFCAASHIAFDTLRFVSDGHEWNTFDAASVGFTMPMLTKLAFCPDEFFICCTVSRMLCR